MKEQATIQWTGEPSRPDAFVTFKQSESRRQSLEHANLRRLRDSRALSWLANRAAFGIGMPILSVMAFATTLYIPRLISPVEFGTYALLLSLFRLASRCDLGLTQLTDQRLAARAGGEADVLHLLNVRIKLGFITLFVGAPVAGWIALRFGLSPLDAVIAVVAGLSAMVASGPWTVFRAQGKIWEYTALAFLSGIGFIVPRLLGFVVDGVTGCFAFWLVWNGSIATCVVLRFAKPIEPAWLLLGTLRKSFPLFVYASAWTFYVTADRWIAAALSSPRSLGIFALGANIAAAGIVTFGQLSDIRYPHWLKRISLGMSFEHSRAIEIEAYTLTFVTTLAVGFAVPLIPFIVSRVFPSYVGAAQPMIALAVSCVPTMIVAWFLPIAIARSQMPIVDAGLIFVPALAVMACGMVVGNHLAGLTGQAWACCLSSVVLLSGLVVVLRRCIVLRVSSALRIIALASFMVSALAVQALLLSRPVAAESSVTVPPFGWRQTFNDTFESLSIWTGKNGTWQPGYVGGIRTNPTNRELEFYASPFDRYLPAVLQPFEAGKNGLTITARRVPKGDLYLTGRLPYVSGLLNSAHSFRFTYGYAVMRARVPKGRGLWPAFWLLPANDEDPPELDVMEVLGHKRALYYATLHSAISGASINTIRTGALDDGFHDFGVMWTQQNITWLFDGSAVATTKTPKDMHGPMYLLVNLAIGGDWPGSPDANTIFPARMQVRSISVYQDQHEDETRIFTRGEVGLWRR